MEPDLTDPYAGSPYSPDLAAIRAQQAAELEQNPDLEQRLYSLTHNEVGGQGTAAQQAFIETLFNRADRRGQSLAQIINDRSYYPGISFRPRPGANYQDTLLSVMRGSDVSGGATGNASGRVGFAGGPQTFAANGERFGIEGPDLKKQGSDPFSNPYAGEPLPATPAAAATPAKSFDTPLTPQEENRFAVWKANYAPKDSGADYDLRGAFKAGLTPDPQTGHWPDTFKKPNHPTFSDQSIYASAAPEKAGHWEGDKYIPAGQVPQMTAEKPYEAPPEFKSQREMEDWAAKHDPNYRAFQEASAQYQDPANKWITSEIPKVRELMYAGFGYSPLGLIQAVAPDTEAAATAERIRQKLSGTGAGFVTPANALMAAAGGAVPTIGRLIGAGFTIAQAQDTVKKYHEWEAETDPEKKSQLAEDLAISGVVTAGLAGATLSPHGEGRLEGEKIVGKEEPVPPPVEPALLTQLLVRRNELLSKGDTSPELDTVEAKIKELGGDVDAIKEGDIQKGRQREYQGVPPGPIVSAHEREVRQGEGGQAGGGGGVVGEAAQPQAVGEAGQKVFGTKNALNQGIAAAEDAARREDADVWAEAEAIHNENPAAPRLLVDELAKNPRPVKDFENHLVLRRQIELQKEYDAAVDKQNKNPGDPSAEAQLNAIIEEQGKVDQVNQQVGREAGLGFRARQILADQDYNLLKMQATARAVVNKGRPLSADQLKEVQGLHDRIKAAEDKIAEYNAREQFRQMVDARRTEPSPARQPVAGAGKLREKTAFLEDAYKRAKQRIVERRGRLQAGIDPTSILDEAIVGAYHIERGLTKFADWSAQMIKDIGEHIKPYLSDLWRRSREYHAETTKGLGRVRGRQEMTPERMLAADKRRVARDIEKYQERVAKGDVSPLRPRPEARPSDKELSGLLFEREQAKTAYHEMLVKAKLSQQSLGRKGLRWFGEGMRTARSIKTAFDVSGVLRQGGFNYFSHPIQATRALSVILKAVRSEKGAFAVMQEIRDRPNYPLYKQAGLFLSEEGGMNLTKMEEVFASRFARRIPGVGASERMYSAYLNRIRADRFDAMAGTLSRFGKLTDGEAKAIANFVNETTGRGYLPAKMQGAAEALNAAFFAPRFVISRFQTLLGHPIWQLERASPRVRGLIALEYARTLTGIGLFIAAATQAGFKVETDRRSTDFMKLRWGNLRIDPMAGIQQVGVLLSRLQSGAKKTSSGKVMPLRGELKFGQASAADVIARFAWSKLGPLPGSTVNVLAGQDPTGRPTTLINEALHFALPLGPQDVISVMQENGVPYKLAAELAVAAGMGATSYGSTTTGQHAAIRQKLERRDKALLRGDVKEAIRLSQ